MTIDTNLQDDNPQDVTDTSHATYTQVASCAIGNYTRPRMQQSLRAKLECEREELKQRQQKSFRSTFRDLFG